MLGRIFFWFAFALFIISVLGTFALAGITVDLFATTLPNKKATLHLEGLHGDVTIHREDSGMFHIAATSMHDAAFGQGVAHAQDRLWQMEFQRRVGRGTLSAAVGKGGLKFDKFMRTLGVYKAAQAAVPLIDTDPTTAELLDGYIAGVNAYIDTKPYLPLEMKVLGIQPEPFTRADSIVWAKIMRCVPTLAILLCALVPMATYNTPFACAATIYPKTGNERPYVTSCWWDEDSHLSASSS